MIPEKDHGQQLAPVSVWWIVAALLRGRRTIMVLAGAGLLLSLAIALTRRPVYTSSFSFVSQTSQDPNRAGLASLAGQFGISLGAAGQTQSPQLYADLLTTREVLGPIVADSFAMVPSGPRAPLPAVLRMDTDDAPEVVRENTIRKLRGSVIQTSVATRTTGVVTVAVRTPSPHVSHDLAAKLIDGLNRFNLVTRQSQAREERRFTEDRLKAARSTLLGAEAALQRFETMNRQWGGSPQLRFQRDTLQREVLLQGQVVTSLAQQYEEVRIREVRDTPVISLIERPNIPAEKDPQGRLLLVVLGTTAGALIGVFAALVRSIRVQASSADPGMAMLAHEWASLRGRTAR